MFLKLLILQVNKKKKKFLYISSIKYKIYYSKHLGTEQFVSMRNLYMKAGEVFVVVYSIVAESTFHETREIREQILDTKEPEVPPIVLVGNKLDLEDQREVKKSVAEEQAREWKCPYIECSAKLNTNISEVFHKAVTLHMGVGDGGKDKKKCILF